MNEQTDEEATEQMNEGTNGEAVSAPKGLNIRRKRRGLVEWSHCGTEGGPRARALCLLTGKTAQAQEAGGAAGRPQRPRRSEDVKLPRVSEIRNRMQGCPTFRLPLP